MAEETKTSQTVTTSSPGTSRHGIFLNASILDEAHRIDIMRNEVKMNRIQFSFPEGYADIPVLEECRVLEDIENFDLMFDVVMQKLTGKPVIIYLKDDTGKAKEVSRFIVTGRYMNLMGVPFIAKYPVVVTWMLDFIQVEFLKKYPLPPESWDELEARLKTQHSRKEVTAPQL